MLHRQGAGSPNAHRLAPLAHRRSHEEDRICCQPPGETRAGDAVEARRRLRLLVQRAHEVPPDDEDHLLGGLAERLQGRASRVVHPGLRGELRADELLPRAEGPQEVGLLVDFGEPVEQGLEHQRHVLGAVGLPFANPFELVADCEVGPVQVHAQHERHRGLDHDLAADPGLLVVRGLQVLHELRHLRVRLVGPPDLDPLVEPLRQQQRARGVAQELLHGVLLFLVLALDFVDPHVLHPVAEAACDARAGPVVDQPGRRLLLLHPGPPVRPLALAVLDPAANDHAERGGRIVLGQEANHLLAMGQLLPDHLSHLHPSAEVLVELHLVVPGCHHARHLHFRSLLLHPLRLLAPALDAGRQQGARHPPRQHVHQLVLVLVVIPSAVRQSLPPRDGVDEDHLSVVVEHHLHGLRLRQPRSLLLRLVDLLPQRVRLVDDLHLPGAEDVQEQQLRVALHDRLQGLQVLGLLLRQDLRHLGFLELLRPAAIAGGDEHAVLLPGHEHHGLHHGLLLRLPRRGHLPRLALRGGDLVPGAEGHLADGGVAVRREHEEGLLGVLHGLLRLPCGPVPLLVDVLEDPGVFVEGHELEFSQLLPGLLRDVHRIDPCAEGRATNHGFLPHVHDGHHLLRGLGLLLQLGHEGLPVDPDVVLQEAIRRVQHLADGLQRTALLECPHLLLQLPLLPPRAVGLDLLRPQMEDVHHEHHVVSAVDGAEHFANPELLLAPPGCMVLRLLNVHHPRQPSVAVQDLRVAAGHDAHQLALLEELMFLLGNTTRPGIE
mmetsp:Transcript_67360/g.197779  ORF Transcript_67360/g.197779 Transcript_67360/m.197779 type:complete len:774 (-) Transcript_67360:554-2875(-)